jgi:hypothetical protein
MGYGEPLFGSEKALDSFCEANSAVLVADDVERAPRCGWARFWTGGENPGRAADIAVDLVVEARVLLIEPFGAGGGPDVVARALAGPLSERSG